MVDNMDEHPLAAELARLFNRPGMDNTTASTDFWNSPNPPLPPPPSAPLSGGRPRLGSDGGEEHTNLSWQPPPLSQYGSTSSSNRIMDMDIVLNTDIVINNNNNNSALPTYSPRSPALSASTNDKGNNNELWSNVNETSNELLQQLSTLASQIGYNETIRLVQLMGSSRLTSLDIERRLKYTNAHMFSQSTSSTTTSFVSVQPVVSVQAHVQPTIQVPGYSVTSPFLYTGLVPPTSPPSPARGSPPSPSVSPPIMDGDHDPAVSRPSRWVSAGLPILTQALPTGDIDCTTNSTGALHINIPYVTTTPYATTPGFVTPPSPITITEWQRVSKLREEEGITKQLLFEILRRNNSKGRSRQDYVCVFCRNNGEAKVIYTSHRLKDVNGAIQCPVLRIYECPTCHASGDNAHTLKYCPKTKDTAARVPLCSPRKSNGKIRVVFQHDL